MANISREEVRKFLTASAELFTAKARQELCASNYWAALLTPGAASVFDGSLTREIGERSIEAAEYARTGELLSEAIRLLDATPLPSRPPITLELIQKLDLSWGQNLLRQLFALAEKHLDKDDLDAFKGLAHMLASQ